MKFWKRHMGAAAITAAAILGLAVDAASAHTNSFTATCSAGVVVNADSYNGDVRNTITLTVDGTTVASVLSFGTSYHFPASGVYKPAPATSSHVVHLVVVAGDGAQFGADQTITIPACSTPATTTVAPTTTVPTTTTTTKASTPSTFTTGPSTTTSSASTSPVLPSSTPSSASPASTSTSTTLASSRRAVVPTTAAPKCDDTGSTGACLPATGKSLTLALLGGLVLAAGVLVLGIVKASARRAAALSVRKP